MAADERERPEAQPEQDERKHPGTGAVGAVAGAAAGAAAGALGGPAGMLVGGVAGAVLGGMAGGRAGRSIDRVSETNLAAPAEPTTVHEPGSYTGAAGVAPPRAEAVPAQPVPAQTLPLDAVPAEALLNLQELVACCADAEYGWRACAAQARQPALKTTLLHCADHCHAAATELQQLMQQAGGRPQETAAALAPGHRGWVAERAMLAGYDDLAVMAESERGADLTVARYRRALQDPLPPAALPLVQKQLQALQADHDEIRRLRDSLRPPVST